MTTLAELRQQVIETLSRWPELQGVSIHTAFDGTLAHIPRQQPQIHVGFAKLTLSPAGLGDMIGTNAQQPLHGAWAEITLQLDLLAAEQQTTPHLYEALEQTAQCLLQSPLGIYQITCDNPQHEHPLLATHLQVNAKLRTCMTQTVPTAVITDIMLKGGDLHT